METLDFSLKIIFLTPVLGTQPTTEIASAYLIKKAGLEERPEDENYIPDVLERGTTVFHRLPCGDPCLANYQVMGFLKESGRVQNGKIKGIRNLRNKVAMNTFVNPRMLPIKIPAGEELDYLERPLRGETAQGPRVTLARSEMLPAGCEVSCGVQALKGSEIDEGVLIELLDYGYFRGIGQWRGSGAYGTFRYTLVRDE